MQIPESLIETLRNARQVTVLTGAGISAESGIPTFREAQTGLWAQYDPADLATPQAFRSNPELVWRWYQWRQEIVNLAQPNPGHFALAKMESHLAEAGAAFTVITQNVDGLHQRAGSQNIIELHGNIHRSKCLDCDQIAKNDIPKGGEIPHCVHCGGLLRPDVVWFGENLPTAALQSAWEAAQNCEVFFSIGTSSLVQPAASLPIVALQNGAEVIEINPTPTQISILAAHTLQGPSGEVLPELVKAVWSEMV
ncbi:MAG TPA: NAD-dependent protein deacylase [Chloroflexi bacterium]|nr:NAD-dependent protein deacylase [Chloroflexota bacterium]